MNGRGVVEGVGLPDSAPDMALPFHCVQRLVQLLGCTGAAYPVRACEKGELSCLVLMTGWLELNCGPVVMVPIGIRSPRLSWQWNRYGALQMLCCRT